MFVIFVYSLIILGIIAAVGIVVLAVFLWRRFGPGVSLLVLIGALVVLAFIAVLASLWIDHVVGGMLV